jgi:hypothetical protein
MVAGACMANLPVVTYRSSAKLSRRMSETLGAVCSHFAMLEWNVDRTIWALTGNDRKKGRHLTLKLLNRRRLERLRKEANTRFGATHKSAIFYNLVADELQKAVDSRNLFVHGIWSKGKAKGTRRQQFVLSYFTNPNGDAEVVDLATLQAFVKIIRMRTLELEIACVKHVGMRLP